MHVLIVIVKLQVVHLVVLVKDFSQVQLHALDAMQMQMVAQPLLQYQDVIQVIIFHQQQFVQNVLTEQLHVLMLLQ